MPLAHENSAGKEEHLFWWPLTQAWHATMVRLCGINEHAAEFGSWAVYLSCQRAADFRDYPHFRVVRLPAHDLRPYANICLSLCPPYLLA